MHLELIQLNYFNKIEIMQIGVRPLDLAHIQCYRVYWRHRRCGEKKFFFRQRASRNVIFWCDAQKECGTGEKKRAINKN